jgi:hypothetical protein
MYSIVFTFSFQYRTSMEYLINSWLTASKSTVVIPVDHQLLLYQNCCTTYMCFCYHGSYNTHYSILGTFYLGFAIEGQCFIEAGSPSTNRFFRSLIASVDVVWSVCNNCFDVTLSCTYICAYLLHSMDHWICQMTTGCGISYINTCIQLQLKLL